MNTDKLAARTFGVFFIIAFLSCGFGSGIVDAIVNTPIYLTNVSTNKTAIIIGAILIAIVHTIVNIGLPVIMIPFLKPFNKTITYGYLAAAITATILLAVGTLFLLLLLPLSNEFLKLETTNTMYLEAIGNVFKKGNYYAYQIGMTIWGTGGLLLCYLLYQSKLIARGISIWGFVGYIIFISGTILELFGFEVGVLLSIPGGFFEIYVSVLLIRKGFRVPTKKSKVSH